MGDTRPIPVDLPSILDAFVHDDPHCPFCLGTGISCETHALPWGDGGGCCGAPGMPCPLRVPCLTMPGGKQMPGGYVRIRVDGEYVLAHRRAWENQYGPIPEGLCVLHHCDNPPCREPEHLFLGTRGDNNADRHRKGRTARQTGEANGRARLTDEQVTEIRRRYVAGARNGNPPSNAARLAIDFGVSLSHVRNLVHGRKRL